MQTSDLQSVVRLGNALHPPSLFESEAALASRFDMGGPAFCHVLCEDEAPRDDDVLHGYVLAHPWTQDDVPKLNEAIGRPPRFDTLFLHDMVLARAARGKGHARAILDLLKDRVAASGYRSISLVAVNGSRPFWQAAGFAPLAMDGGMLRPYGEGACFMRWTS